MRMREELKPVLLLLCRNRPAIAAVGVVVYLLLAAWAARHQDWFALALDALIVLALLRSLESHSGT